MTCLAGPCEPLDRHLLEVAECVAREGALVAHKLARVFSVGTEEALDLVVFAALLHDVGKADVEYNDESGYYPRHEVKSTAVAYKAMKRLGLVENCRLNGESGISGICKAVLAAIALHHYSHKAPKAGASSFKARCGDPVHAIKKWSPHTPLGASMKGAVIAALEEGTENLCFDNIVNSLSKTPPRLASAISAILGVLNKCDIETAKKNRCKETTSASSTKELA